MWLTCVHWHKHDSSWNTTLQGCIYVHVKVERRKQLYSVLLEKQTATFLSFLERFCWGKKSLCAPEQWYILSTIIAAEEQRKWRLFLKDKCDILFFIIMNNTKAERGLHICRDSMCCSTWSQKSLLDKIKKTLDLDVDREICSLKHLHA